jgi:hypothetical protein
VAGCGQARHVGGADMAKAEDGDAQEHGSGRGAAGPKLDHRSVNLA